MKSVQPPEKTEEVLAVAAPGQISGGEGDTQGFLAEVWDWIKSILLALLLVMVIHQFIFNLSTVKGHSMEPTLYEGEWLFVNKIGYRLGSPERGDVVIFKDPDPSVENPQYLVKRVVGITGDRLEIHKGRLYRNGKIVNEPYIDTSIEDGEFAAVNVGEGQVFVMGDNRHRGASKDSRFFGVVPERIIEGRAQVILWPVKRWAVLGHMDERLDLNGVIGEGANY